MKRIDFYFDVVSPEVWWAFDGLPEALAGHGVVVELRPVLLTALPALPPPLPFDSLALQRLALACAPAGGTPGRVVVERLLRHVWCRDGADPNDAQALAALTAELAPRRDPADAAVLAELQAGSAAAAAAGVQCVPTLRCDGHAFVGTDALPTLRAWLQGRSPAP